MRLVLKGRGRGGGHVVCDNVRESGKSGGFNLSECFLEFVT